MVVFPIGSLTEFVTELTMSMIGNSSLQHAARAMISASIVKRAVSVCSFDCHKTGQSTKVTLYFGFASVGLFIKMTFDVYSRQC